MSNFLLLLFVFIVLVLLAYAWTGSSTTEVSNVQTAPALTAPPAQQYYELGNDLSEVSAEEMPAAPPAEM